MSFRTKQNKTGERYVCEPDYFRRPGYTFTYIRVVYDFIHEQEKHTE